MIRDGTLKPGERVNEQALAAQLGVGRNSAREALRLLERSGLVHIVPNRGAEVRKITLEEALDLYDVRAGLARVAGRLAASRLAALKSRSWSRRWIACARRSPNGTAPGTNTLNGTLHNLMMNAAKNARLLEINAGVEDELSLYLHKGVYSNSQMQRSWKSISAWSTPCAMAASQSSRSIRSPHRCGQAAHARHRVAVVGPLSWQSKNPGA
jgi:DNA-binding GntR family transcriptional regulator